MIELVLALAAATPPVGAPPPLPVISAVAPPAIRTVPAPAPAVDLDVEIRSGNTLLWAGPMRVAQGIPASFNTEKTDAPAGICPAGRRPGYGGMERSSLRVNVSRGYELTSTDYFQVQVTWLRPVADRGCGDEAASRSVGITQPVTLPAGGRATAQGDAGLSVLIRRR